jgi:hypothetical protein
MRRPPQSAHPWRRTVLVLLLTVALTASVRAQEMHSEFDVKAAYLFRFADYVEWPDPPVPTHPFVIAVIGPLGMTRALLKLQPGHLIHQQTVQIIEVTRVQELETARVLYVGAGHNELLRTIVETKTWPVLIVTDEDQGLGLGGVVNFVTVDNRVRFEVSLAAAERAHLKVSADLLSVAIRVNGGRRQSAVGCPSLSFPESDDALCGIRQAWIGRDAQAGLIPAWSDPLPLPSGK